MNFISVRDLRGKSAEVWRRMNANTDLVVTSNGRPIAILSKVSEETLEESLAALRHARALQAVEAMQRSSVEAGRDRLSSEAIEAEIAVVRKTRVR